MFLDSVDLREFSIENWEILFIYLSLQNYERRAEGTGGEEG